MRTAAGISSDFVSPTKGFSNKPSTDSKAAFEYIHVHGVQDYAFETQQPFSNLSHKTIVSSQMGPNDNRQIHHVSVDLLGEWVQQDRHCLFIYLQYTWMFNIRSTINECCFFLLVIGIFFLKFKHTI